MRKTHSRRRVLEAVGLAAAGGLAGCAEDGATTPTATGTPTATPTEQSAIPSYADFVPDGDGPVGFTMWDLDIEPGHRISTVPEEPTDPLRYGSTLGAYVEFLTGGFMQMLTYPFDADRLDTGGRERTLNVNGVAVQELPVDLSGAIADAESGDATVQFEADDRAVIAGSTGGTFGLTEDALAFPVVSAADATALVRDVVDTRAGAATPRHETDDSFAALLRAGDTTGSVACGYGPETDLSSVVGAESSLGISLPAEGYEAASGAVFHIDLDNGDPPQPASGTVRYADESSVDAESLSSLGSAAENRELTQDGQTVRVTGEYSWESLSAFDGADES